MSVMYDRFKMDGSSLRWKVSVKIVGREDLRWETKC